MLKIIVIVFLLFSPCFLPSAFADVNELRLQLAEIQDMIEIEKKNNEDLKDTLFARKIELAELRKKLSSLEEEVALLKADLDVQ
jgi:predicted nuclease with TOPRIM domain